MSSDLEGRQLRIFKTLNQHRGWLDWCRSPSLTLSHRHHQRNSQVLVDRNVVYSVFEHLSGTTEQYPAAVKSKNVKFSGDTANVMDAMGGLSVVTV